MANNVRIPQSRLPLFQKFLAEPPELVENFITFLENFSGNASLDEFLESLDKKIPNFDEYVTVFIETSIASRRLSIDSNEFAEGLVKSTKESSKTEQPLDFDLAFRNFIRILNSKGIISLSKQGELTEEFPRVFSDSRIVTDVRPVFSENLDESGILSYLVVHTLKLNYYENGNLSSSYIKIDLGDLNNLKEQIDRAIAKQAYLSEHLKLNI
ncbi:hypothetical protein [Leptospira harrisiae]|uniref:hypothetical protein n=1 Tax=Leptospira harrisiae TaxID=2023189 RepID=UPI000C29B37A|nr:hypothetical protein [Leptospira harrisiae]PKA06386.1 hypothetical protein CH366_19405 [Leptospira harrisiae]